MIAQTIPYALWFVVRRAHLATDLAAHGPVRSIGDRVYQGIDRMPWYDVQDACLSGTLPPSLCALWQRIDHSSVEPWCVTATQCLRVALTLLNGTPEIKGANEVICAAPVGCPGSDAKDNVQWIGYDPLYLSSRPYTLLTPLYNALAEPLGRALPNLNSAGLFDTADGATSYGALYRELSDPNVNIVEFLPLFDEAFHVVSVGRYVTAE
jgi:hypothetical protein